jgi:hypothetical protein
MPSEETGLIQVQRTGCFLPKVSNWGETPEISWRVSPAVVEEAKKHAPSWTDDRKLAKLIAEAIRTKDIKKALEELRQGQSAKYPQTAVYLPGKVELSVPGRETRSVRVTIKVVKDGIEIHPKDIITV